MRTHKQKSLIIILKVFTATMKVSKALCTYIGVVTTKLRQRSRKTCLLAIFFFRFMEAQLLVL